MRKKKYLFMAVFVAMLFIAAVPIDVQAEEAVAHFGSDYYSKVEGEEFNIGLYLVSQESLIEEYSLTMTYNPQIMEYMYGADSGGDGTITISGVAGKNQVKELVHFRAIGHGNVEINISEAFATTADEEIFDIDYQTPVMMMIEADNPIYLDSIRVLGEDIEGFQSELVEYQIEVPYEIDILPLETVGGEVAVSDLNLCVGDNTIIIRVDNNGGTDTVYTLHVSRNEKETTEEIQVEEAELDKEAHSDNMKKFTIEYQGTENPYSTYVESDDRKEMFSRFLCHKSVLIPLLIVFVIILIASGFVTFLEYKKEMEQEKRRSLVYI